MTGSPSDQAADKKELVKGFHQLYYHSLSWDQNSFLGYQIKQCPFDLQLYQELLHRIKPHYVLQTGIAGGGSILYFASLFDMLGLDNSHVVIGIDVQLSDAARSLRHPRIRLIEGSSTDPHTLGLVNLYVGSSRHGLVSLDSDHSCSHVARELELYPPYTGIGSYLVVEDTNIGGHPVFPGFGAGPYDAVEAFLQRNTSFVRDDQIWRKNLFSFHQHGWLRRIK